MSITATRPHLLIRNRLFLASDLLLTLIAAGLGFAVRLDVPLFWTYLPVCARFAILAGLIKLPTYYLFGLYRRYWRYASISELLLIASATSTASAILSAAVFLGVLMPQSHFVEFPRSALVIDWLFSVLFVGGTRFSIRYLGEFAPSTNGHSVPGRTSRPRRVLVVGAGEAGSMIVREMRANSHLGMVPVGFVDDDRDKLGMRIRGLPVLGTRESIPKLVRQHRINQVLIAMPTAPGLAIRAIREICNSVPVPVKTIPGMYELLSGTVQVSQIRDVQIEDLLRRDPVRMSPDDTLYLRGKSILVTGAGGSIGSELCRQIAHRQPRQLILLGHGENSIYHIYHELQESFPALALEPVIADVRDETRMIQVLRRYYPQFLFHAAAHKHVPLMERNAEEAITNNVLGTRVALEAAERAGTERFVLISSDKAVDPCNLMGASKRIAELLVQDAARRTGSKFIVVRFGNVLGSRGSVVPLFKRQIAAGGPVTITHPDMERYFMTISEAVYLVLQAAALGKGGELLVLNMGEPIRIVNLARDLITLSGLQPGRDIEILFTRARPGEKLQEHLFLDSEDPETTAHTHIFVAKAPLPLSALALQEGVTRLVEAAQRGSSAEAFWSIISSILPEHRADRVEATRGDTVAPADARWHTRPSAAT